MAGDGSGKTVDPHGVYEWPVRACIPMFTGRCSLYYDFIVDNYRVSLCRYWQDSTVNKFNE